MRLHLVEAAEIPGREQQAQVGFAVDIEFDLDIAGVRADGFHRQPQPGGDLGIGVAQASQRRDLLFAWRERLPAVRQVSVKLAVREGFIEQVRDHFIR